MADATILWDPNSEAIVASVIRTVFPRVYSSIPDNPVWPLMLVARNGGLPKKVHIDRARLQVECIGGTQKQALDGVREAIATLRQYEGSTFKRSDGWPDDAVITHVEVISSPFRLQDTITKRERYIATINVTLHPITPTEPEGS
jgi:hypothetical protein